MKKRKKRWSYSFGDRGRSRVRVCEDSESPYIQINIADPSTPCGRRSRSLGHKEKTKAIRQAKEESLKLEQGLATLVEPKPTLGRILGLYLTHQTVKKCSGEQKSDHRRAKLWSRVCGVRQRTAMAALHSRGPGRICHLS